MHAWGTLLAELAGRRGGLILTCDLKAAGLSDKMIRRVTKELYRICRGAYALERPPDKWAEHRLYVRAAFLRHDLLVAVSHLSAAVMHDFPLWGVDLGLAHLTGIGHVRRGIRAGVHTYEGPLAVADVVDIDGMEVTNAARTVMDCARTLPFDRAVAIGDHALHKRLVTLEELQFRCNRLSTVTGIDEARRLIEMIDGRAESPGESRSRLTLVQAGITVEPQVEIRSRGGSFVGRVDLLVEGCVVAEFDGRVKYTLAGDVERAHWDEKHRHDALQEAGYIVVRLTWADLARPADVVARVRRAITRAKAFGLPAS